MTILAALILALLISIVFSLKFGIRESSGMPVVLVFFILVLSGLAAQYWMAPLGPLVWGISWMPLVAGVLIIALLLAATSPYLRRTDRGSKEKPSGDVKAAATISIFMWVLLFALGIIAFVGYIRLL